MIKELIMFDVIFYLILAFVWQILFENKFMMKYSCMINGKEEIKIIRFKSNQDSL